MEDKINRIFDKLENAHISPTSNYGVAEYWMHRAIRGSEKDKRTLFNWLSGILGFDMDVLNKVFDERYGNSLNETKLRRMIAESVKKALREGITKDDKGRLIWEPGVNDTGYFEDDDFSIGSEGANGWPNLIDRKTGKESGYQLNGWRELPNNMRRYSIWNNVAKNSTDFISPMDESINRIVSQTLRKHIR